MKDLVEILAKLWIRKYWILGISFSVMIVGLIFKIPAIKNKEYQATAEFYLINTPQDVKIDFNKNAAHFVKKTDVNETLSQKFGLQNPKIATSFGKNKNICFSVVNSNPELAENIVKELVNLFNIEVNDIINTATFGNIDRINYLIILKQQQIDSIKHRLITLYEQAGIKVSKIDNAHHTNNSSKFLSSATEKGVNIFAEETMLFNAINDLSMCMNERDLIISQKNIESEYVNIITEPKAENAVKKIQLLKFLIGVFIIGLLVSISWFLLLDFGIPVFKSFWEQLLEKKV